MTASPDTKTLSQERWFALLVLLVVAIWYWQSLLFAPNLGLSELSGPETYPRLLLIGLFLLATIVVIKPRRKSVPDDEPSDLRSKFTGALNKHSKPALVVALFVAYLGTLQQFDFLVTSMVFLLVTQFVLMEKRNTRLILIVVVISICLPFALEYIFADLLGIFLP